MCLSVGTGRKTTRSFLIRRPLIALTVSALYHVLTKVERTPQISFANRKIRKTGGLTKFVRLTDLQQMWQFTDLQFADQFFYDLRFADQFLRTLNICKSA